MLFLSALLIFGACATAVADTANQQPLALQSNYDWSSNETIYTSLSGRKQFSKLNKAINFADNIASVLNDSSAEITFFAVPDKALHRPRHGDIVSSDYDSYDLADAIELIEEFESLEKDDEVEDKRKRKKILKKIVSAILSYHILPHKLDAKHLATNNTFATHLVLPKDLHQQPLRLRVAHNPLSPLLTINFYSKVIKPDNDAYNGIIHVVNHPLLPPPPAFQELFLASSIFSTFTSAIQRTGLTDELDLHFVHRTKGKRWSIEGAKAVTVFAPTNRAFQELPANLRLFLFSPFGTRALRKLLQYHIVPDMIFHTDHLYNKTDDAKHMERCRSSQCHQAFGMPTPAGGQWGAFVYPFKYHGAFSRVDEMNHGLSGWLQPEAVELKQLPHPEPIESYGVVLGTVLANHTLHARVEKFKFRVPIPGHHKPHIMTTHLTINGHRVAAPDVTSLNGAVHIIEHLLDPRGHEQTGFSQWDGWETWLPQWAGSN